jgi:hypothetical protein
MKYMLIKEGENSIRIVGTPEQRFVHWTRSDTGHMKAVICDFDTKCSHCTNGDKARARFYIPVIDRDDGECKMLVTGPQIYKGIRSYVTNPMWGSPDHYDIKIYRKPRGHNPLYAVLANPILSSLTPEERQKADQFLNMPPEELGEKPQPKLHDECKTCGGIGEVRGTACICVQCGNLIWGC